LLVVGTRGKNISPVFRKPGENACDLGGSFPLAQYHFRHSIAQGAVMIDLGESKILKWKMAQTIDRVVRRDRALANLLEKTADGFGVQVEPSRPFFGQT
jgi:hypothetical protein